MSISTSYSTATLGAFSACATRHRSRLSASQCWLVHVGIVDPARGSSLQNASFGVDPFWARRLDLGLRQFHWDDLLARHVAAAFRPLLVLDQDRAHAHALVALHRMHYVLHVAIAVV